MNVFDNFTKEDYDTRVNGFFEALNLNRFDWTHFNSFFFDEGDSSIYISFRNLSRIIKIDYPSGNIIWMMGLDYPYMASGNNHICTELEFSYQHHIQKLNNGNLLFFDNGNLSTQLFNEVYPISRILEINVIDNSLCEVVYEYPLPSSLFSTAMGSVQSLDNNNYLINSIAGNGKVFEVNQNKNIVWESNLNLDLPASNYRTFRIPGIHPDAFSVLFSHLNSNDSLKTINSDYLSIDIFNKSEYKQPYTYSLNDANNCFDSINDTINLDSNNDTTLTFNYDCDNLDETYINFIIKPQYHEYAEKNYYINFIYEDFNYVDEIPSNYSLEKAYPNPLNPKTNIEYSIGSDGYTKIAVYNLQGQLIEYLVDEYKTLGNYIVLWDAASYSSGVYFIKMNVNGFSSNQKVMLIK